MIALLLALVPLLGTQVTPMKAIDDVLDDFHDAAAKADGPRYFGHFAPRAVFVGTDASERWTVAEFKAYADPHFSKGNGWTYIPRDREVHLGPDGRTAWFYERLSNAKYGETRGSGALILVDGHWRIAQYVLSFSIPNGKTAAVLGVLRGPVPTD